ncbi:MAG: thiamine pyrophosphate-binding protein [Rubrivivax sp.]|nr:thiamine pyrophosphate-binding protein [Rubrivivax sp.]
MRGADLLVHALQRAGVGRVFSLSGNHVMAVYDALAGSGVELVHVRHEAAAVHMADAWARLTGRPGVALVTGGPGHANALGALYTAAMAESPVLLLSGHAPRAQLGLGAFQEMRQADAAAPLCKPGGAWTSEHAGRIGSDLERALALARAGRNGPVHLSLPSDLLEERLTVAPAPPVCGEASAPPVLPLAPNQADEVLAWLGKAQRPLVLAGPWAAVGAMPAACAALHESLQVPVICMESPRGISDPAHGDLGAVLAGADAVLLLGKRVDFTLRFGNASLFASEAQFVQLDAETRELERGHRALGPRLRMALQADPQQAVRALRAEAHALPATRGPWLREVAQALAWRPPAWAAARAGQPQRLHPVQALQPLQALLDSHPRSTFIADGGEFGQWAQAVLHAPRRLINGVAGAIGPAVPFAVAARLAEPDAPVVAVMGDGTFGFHMAELDTAVRCRAPFLAVIGNDARWNAEHQIQLREYGAARAIGCDLLPTRYDLAAAALGAHGECIDDASQLPAAFERARAAMARGLPACLNVMIESQPAPVLRRPGDALARP